MRVYIAGKMTGLPMYGFPLFDKAKERLQRIGHDVVSPADIDRALGFDPAYALEQPSNELILKILLKEFEEIYTVDGIVFLPNAGDSKGAKMELRFAQFLNETLRKNNPIRFFKYNPCNCKNLAHHEPSEII